ncbi:MAG TPA: hypothetical protein VNV66_11925 [Pilimelia sp.]|nr:hypothetical protein [Pilimelia sp.]
MPYEEKGLWVFLVTTVGAYAGYLTVVLGRADSASLADRPYAAAMLWSIGIAIVGSIVGRILVELARPSEMTGRDARDHDIHRFGEYVGGLVLSAAMVVPLGLSLVEAAHFWIANAIYAGFVLAAVTATTVKLVGHHRGL